MNVDRGARLTGAGVVSGLGIVTFGIHLFHGLTTELTLWSLTFGVVIPLLLSASLVIVGGSLVADGMAGTYVLRVAGWAIGGTAALSALGVLTALSQHADTAAVSNPGYAVANLATGGALTGVLVGLYDVGRRRTERRLTYEREKADRLGQQLAVLNRVLRHDVRNGVNVIAGFAELVRSEPESADEHARRIERKAAELEETSQNARRVEQMINGDGTVQSIDVAECVARGIERIRCDYPDVTVHADLPESARVSAHPLVYSAVENILDNAVEHNDEPDPTVTVNLSWEPGGDRDFVSVRIADDGPGVPQRELAVLEEGRETQLRHASGLGLWLVNWIVTESGGDVEFEERDPRGSVVTFFLPAADHEETD